MFLAKVSTFTLPLQKAFKTCHYLAITAEVTKNDTIRVQNVSLPGNRPAHGHESHHNKKGAASKEDSSSNQILNSLTSSPKTAAAGVIRGSRSQS